MHPHARRDTPEIRYITYIKYTTRAATSEAHSVGGAYSEERSGRGEREKKPLQNILLVRQRFVLLMALSSHNLIKLSSELVLQCG